MVMTTSCSARHKRRGAVLLPVIGFMTLIVLLLGFGLISYMVRLIQMEQKIPIRVRPTKTAPQSRNASVSSIYYQKAIVFD